MAQRPAIVPCLQREAEGYDPYRLMVERSLCINTAAAGGNAALMTLDTQESTTPKTR
jgi:delta 1-pyrroline-5-carboxylate dehydrogenase